MGLAALLIQRGCVFINFPFSCGEEEDSGTHLICTVGSASSRMTPIPPPATGLSLAPTTMFP